MKFNYQARTKEGQIQSGVIEASSKEAALSLLQNYGVYVTYLEEVAVSLYARKFELFKGISLKDLAVFTRQLAIMFKANVPVMEALYTLAQQTKNQSFKEKIQKIAEEVEGGTLLSQALAAYPDIFSPFFTGMIKSGEASGKLSEVLEYLAEHMERSYNFSSKFKMAMVYPAFISFVFLVVIGLMVVFVVPQLSRVLKDTGQELPSLTKLVISFSDFLMNFWYIIILLFLVVILLLLRLFKTKIGKDFIDENSLNLPILGDFFKKIYLAQLAENLSTLISSGLPIIQAFEITGDIVNNNVYKTIIGEIKEGVKRGEPISLILSKYPQSFPPLFVQMTVVGERTGQLDLSLLNVAGFYQEDVSRTLDGLIALLEPLMLIVLGVMVAIFIGSILLPIYQISIV